MGAKYDQLDLDERIQMLRLYEAGTSRREIGRIIGRSASTVSRELRRNTLPRGGYKPASADRIARSEHPPASILHVDVPCAGGSPAYLEIDKLPDGTYRATVETLFEHQEICITRDLEALVRQANAMAGCRSFDDVVRAFRVMQRLG